MTPMVHCCAQRSPSLDLILYRGLFPWR